MGLFGRKKKISKKDKEMLESARKSIRIQNEQREKSEKEFDLRRRKEREQKKQYDEEQKILIKKKAKELHDTVKTPTLPYEERLRIQQEKFNKRVKSLNRKNIVEKKSDNITQIGCLVDNCNVKVDFFTGKKCKFCNNQYCFEHVQMEKHDCVKTTPTKFLRKTWLRKYGLNISSGRFIVVCDNCHYVSKRGSLIDVAGDERKKHVESKKCNSNLVFLEEDLINEKIPKIKNFEQTVPTDRILWVCSHCRPPQKFTDRSAYIAHHYTHS